MKPIFTQYEPITLWTTVQGTRINHQHLPSKDGVVSLLTWLADGKVTKMTLIVDGDVYPVHTASELNMPIGFALDKGRAIIVHMRGSSELVSIDTEYSRHHYGRIVRIKNPIPKNLLKIEETTIRIIQDRDLDKFVEQVYGKNPELYALEEVPPNSFRKITLPTSQTSVSSAQAKAFQDIRQGKYPTLGALGLIMRCLHEDGLIPDGGYQINFEA